MGKQLVVIAGLERGRVLPLDETDVLQLGCSQTLEVNCRLRDPKVARVHCEIQVDGDRVTVVDSDTPFGTFLNGERITQQELQPGDVIRIGSTELRYFCDGSQQDAKAEVKPTAAESDEFVCIEPATKPPATQDEPWSVPLSSLSDLLPLLDDSDSPAATPRPRTSVARTETAKETAPHAQVFDMLVGKNFAIHFKVEAELGLGYWGRVYRARDTRIDNTVALKVLRPEFGESQETMEHFGQALRVVLPLHHPNLLLHYGAGKCGPFCWIAMEYVGGRSLSQLVRRAATAGISDWRQALQVAIQLGRALERLEQRRMIHGSITPQNVLIRDRDRAVKLGDLLLARTLAAKRTEALKLPSRRYDDLPYMSPERTSGTEVLDARSDLYGVGATVYALLTGRPPLLGKSPEDTILKIQEAEPVKPSKYQRSLPDLFDRAVLKLLSKRPADRFQTAGELLAELDPVVKCFGMTI